MTLIEERREMRCSICHRSVERVWHTDDYRPVCGDCIAGYRICPHGYARLCYACGRGFDEYGHRAI